MKWFNDHKAAMIGPDSEVSGSTYASIAKIADEALDDETMARFLKDFFGTQKRFGEYIGVGESTVAGWVKSGSFPDYAKRAALAAYYSTKYYRELLSTKRDADRPKVVKDDNTYLVVRFLKDDVGVAIGEILARDIPNEKAALIFAGALRAHELLEETLVADRSGGGQGE